VPSRIGGADASRNEELEVGGARGDEVVRGHRVGLADRQARQLLEVGDDPAGGGGLRLVRHHDLDGLTL
jgi:hypothetical protein